MEMDLSGTPSGDIYLLQQKQFELMRSVGSAYFHARRPELGLKCMKQTQAISIKKGLIFGLPTEIPEGKRREEQEGKKLRRTIVMATDLCAGLVMTGRVEESLKYYDYLSRMGIEVGKDDDRFYLFALFSSGRVIEAYKYIASMEPRPESRDQMLKKMKLLYKTGVREERLWLAAGKHERNTLFPASLIIQPSSFKLI